MDVGPGCHAEETGRATAPDEDKRSPVIELEGSFLYACPLFQTSPPSS